MILSRLEKLILKLVPLKHCTLHEKRLQVGNHYPVVLQLELLKSDQLYAGGLCFLYVLFYRTTLTSLMISPGTAAQIKEHMNSGKEDISTYLVSADARKHHCKK